MRLRHLLTLGWIKGGVKYAVGFAIAIHFTAILAVICHLDDAMAGVPFWQPLLALINRYSLVTCANRNFGFFAPTVTPDWNLRILIHDADAEPREFTLPCASREMEVKMYSMLGHFSENEDTMDLFARSWAVYALNTNPTATRVDIRVTRNRVPTMRAFRSGERTQVDPFYRTTFELK